MKLLSCHIRNFKGIKSVTIDLRRDRMNGIVTLVGLNESGKTSILEAIDYFRLADSGTSTIFDPQFARPGFEEIIPREKIAKFTDSILVTFEVELEDSDIDAVAAELKSPEIQVDKKSFKRIFVIQQVIKYESSQRKSNSRGWGHEFSATVSGTITKVSYTSQNGLWSRAATVLWNRFPEISYFPSATLDFPSRIYLQPYQNEQLKSVYFRTVVSDLMKAAPGSYDIQTHVVERVKRLGSVNWLGYLTGPDRLSVESVLDETAQHLTKHIFGRWQKIFGKENSRRRIEIILGYDPDKEALFVEFYISDEGKKFSLAQRSSGFRWFFAFLMLTSFKGAGLSAGRILLLDEPAANLHARAQSELIASLKQITGPKDYVVYSTHSHSLIEPAWLGSAYVVDNRAIDMDAATPFNVADSEITATRYATFVGQHPDKTTYFQPILECLHYAPTRLELSKPALLVEGITDWSLLDQIIGSEDFALVPGSGASSLDPLISIFLGWGLPVAILLDDDKAGTEAAKRYYAAWPLPKSSIRSLASFGSPNIDLEKLIRVHHTSDIQAAFEITRVSDKHIQRFVRERAPNDASFVWSQPIRDFAFSVREWARKQLINKP